MLVRPDCIPCYLVQCLSALRQANIAEEKQQVILRKICSEMSILVADRTPSYNSSLVLLRCYDLAGAEDPFAQAKQASNEHARRVLDDYAFDPHAEDALTTALKLALAGNVIDLGIQNDYDIEGNLADVMKNGLNDNSVMELADCLAAAQSILVIGDNSGEIVFDTALVKVMLAWGKDVT